MSKRDFKAIFWMHLLLIILAYASFLYVDWKIILAGAIVLHMYYSIRGGCDLTFREFGKDRDTTFAWYYLRKIFPNLNQKKTKFFVRYILPFILVVLAALIQIKGHYEPLIRL